ncbi:hypothetical protein [Sphingorhabdus sp.]|uniref:hypothetical protein n=1 Tax=Sphingorhabdus sp. TaxID=1902408 RepID=UPI00333EAE40
MVKAAEVFVPSDYPTVTYVQRDGDSLEEKVARALDTPKSPISISGPSKSGKTALVKNMVGEDNLIQIYGTQIEAAGDLWKSILDWIETPTTVSTSSGATESVVPNISTSARIGVPALAEVTIGGRVQTTTAANSNSTATMNNQGMAAVSREIANSDFIVFVDDFHYIAREMQEAVGRQIKTGSDAGIRFCIASVPHRSDDVVRSNHELRGRTVNIDTSYWSESDLTKIPELGFRELNVTVDDIVFARLAKKSCTSPQIMQALCLELCFDKKIKERFEERADISVSEDDIKDVLEKTSTRTDYSSLLRQMHAGPRVRGTERKEFHFVDGSMGDAYRACLLAIKADPPTMSYNYHQILERISAVCVDEKPSGSSLTESLKQISGFAEQMHATQRIVEWDPDAASGTFSIIDPYFLFFLRSSDLIERLGKIADGQLKKLI